MREALTIDVDARGVARLTLDRPDRMNAFNDRLISELTDAFNELDRGDAVRVVVIAGAGEAFCAGGDIAWMQAINQSPRAQRVRGSRAVAEMLEAGNRLGKPLIARIHGAVFGGGVGLAAISDVAVASQKAVFALSEVRLGLVPATISPHVVRRIGNPNMRRYALSGRRFTSDEAARLGLVDRVAAPDELDLAVESEVAAFLEAAPEAIRMTKALIAYVSSHSDHDNIPYTADRLADAWETECGREGISTFLEKTVPSWRRQSAKS